MYNLRQASREESIQINEITNKIVFFLSSIESEPVLITESLLKCLACVANYNEDSNSLYEMYFSILQAYQKSNNESSKENEGNEEFSEEFKGQLLKFLNETFYFFKDGRIERRDEIPAVNREIIVDDFQGNAPSAYLFGSGAAMYFDENGNQMCDLQCFGLSGLKRFVTKYPEAEVRWAIWRKDSQLIDKESLKSLLKYIKEDVDMRIEDEG